MEGHQGGAAGIIASLLPLLVLFAIFYFLLIRPQQKQAREHKEMIASLKKGDKIVTAGGLIAEVQKVEDEFFYIKLNDETVVKLSKDFVHKKLDLTTNQKEQNA